MTFCGWWSSRGRCRANYGDQ